VPDSAKRTSVEIYPVSVAVSGAFQLSPRPAVPWSEAPVAPWAGPRGLPALSLRADGRQVLRGPASKEEGRGEILPSPDCPVADKGSPTKISVSGCVPSTVTSRGGEFVALNLERDRVSIPSRYLTDWVCRDAETDLLIDEEEDDARRTHVLTLYLHFYMQFSLTTTTQIIQNAQTTLTRNSTR